METCYIGMVGSDIEVSDCRDSLATLKIRPGDSSLVAHRYTKGYEARQQHINNLIASKHDYLFLMDGDMVFPDDMLERLRAHQLPYVSGIYMRRQFAPQPLSTVWFYPFDGNWPMRPWIGVPESGKLHEIGASGWGCILIHREVIEKVRGLLKGEMEVFEDYMDIWPYDLMRIFKAIGGLEQLAANPPNKVNLVPALKEHVGVLKEEIRPLKVAKDRVGSDIRFPFYAKAAGYQLMGDPDARCGHMIHYPLAVNDLETVPEEVQARVKYESDKANNTNADQVRQARELAEKALKGELP